MSTAARDITEIVLTRTQLVRDIEGLRKKCLQLPMIEACEAELASFKGRPIPEGRYAVDIAGSLKLTTKLQVAVTVEAAGIGEIDREGRTIEIKDVRILNDFHGVLGRVLGMAGYTKGRAFNLRPGDSAMIRDALAA
jgi:hypothetical protein